MHLFRQYPLFRFLALTTALGCVLPILGETTIEELEGKIEAVQAEYEERISELEEQLVEKSEPDSAITQPRQSTPTADLPRIRGNVFNPSISVVLDGQLASFTENSQSIPGFAFGHEAERSSEGFSLGHSEIVVSSNVDDKLFGNLTLGIESHAGEAAGIEVEEAFFQTLPNAGLPDGVRVKAGRALWTFGYLNELHTHADDFSDRPLPNRAFLDSAYNDDGIELSLVLPTSFYSEVGTGAFRSDDTPFGSSSSGTGAHSFFGRIGGDFGQNGAWRLGGYLLSGEASGRGGADAHDHGHAEEEHGHDEDEGEHADHDDHDAEEEEGHHEEDEFTEVFTEGLFDGNTNMSGIDFRYVQANPFGAIGDELIFQFEYLVRNDDGHFELEEMVLHHEEEEEQGHHEEEEEEEHHEEDEEYEVHLISEEADVSSSSWYAQAIYKFSPRWRLGFRYAQLTPPDEVDLGFDPHTISAMLDFSNSEFSRFRLQYNREVLGNGVEDDQIILQYVMSIGAHAAHPF